MKTQVKVRPFATTLPVARPQTSCRAAEEAGSEFVWAATIRRWRAGIVHLFRDRVPNGVPAGSNHKSKRLTRMADGLPHFAHLRGRILMAFAPEATAPP